MGKGVEGVGEVGDEVGVVEVGNVVVRGVEVVGEVGDAVGKIVSLEVEVGGERVEKGGVVGVVGEWMEGRISVDRGGGGGW